jgi:L-xylulokinase
MLPEYLLGVDTGLSVTKAALYDRWGRVCGSGSAPARYTSPRPRWVEKDPDEQWLGCVEAIRGALGGVDPGQVAAIGVTGHGDGLMLLDEYDRALSPSYPSLDTRAHRIVERWRRDGVADRVLELSGEAPFAQHAPAILAWLSEHQPEVLRRAAGLIFPKDLIKLRLTGVVCTDPTEASAGMTGVSSRQYSSDVFSAYGLDHVFRLLPPVLPSTTIVGHVTTRAAEETGCRAGTPVVSGLHDVDASALGAGCHRSGQLVMIAGTYSVNEVLGPAPLTDHRWLCRDWVQPELWMHMSTSAASATNLDWFSRQLSPYDHDVARRAGTSPYALLAAEAEAATDHDGEVLYLPFLYGSPHGEHASAAFVGIRGWHTRGHLLRALMEGVVFNHRTHVDPLRATMPVTEVRLAGGGARSAWWSQIFADVLDVPLMVTATEETGTLGAALCAGVGVGWFTSLEEATKAAVRVEREHEPSGGARQRRLLDRYDQFTHTADALAPVWQRMSRRSA